MFELYLDTADIEQIRTLSLALPLTGITTNPSILATSGIGLRRLLAELREVLGDTARYHVQVVSTTVEGMVAEGRELDRLPDDVVVKVPATTAGLAVIKSLKQDNIPVLATAIYTVQQGFLAALCGADYLAPYVNRIDNLGADGIGVVAELQSLLVQQNLSAKILAASFKSVQQAMNVIQCGVAAITLPPDIAAQMLMHPAVAPAVAQFSEDWQKVYGDNLAFQS
jgi:fructose-6-phosphate aldolase 1